MSKNVALFLGIGVLIGCGLGLLFGDLITQCPSVATTSVPGVLPARMMIDYGDGRVSIFDIAAEDEGGTLLALLEKMKKDGTLEFTTKSFAGLGRLIESIGDRVNGQEGRYWQYWVNHRAVPVGADEYRISPGAMVEWKFINYKGEK